MGLFHTNEENVSQFSLFFYGHCDRLIRIEKWDILHKIRLVEVHFG